MTADKEAVPVAVENLRKIWNLKKSEMKITQVQAARQLGWTQGAFSQYLNNITDLNPAAVIKLANFLGVDPAEIDPNINEALPHIHKLEVRFALSTGGKKLTDSVSVNSTVKIFCIRIDVDDLIFPKGSLLTVCDPEQHDYIPRTTSNEPWFVIQRRGVDEFELCQSHNLPLNSSLKRKFLVLSVNTY